MRSRRDVARKESESNNSAKILRADSMPATVVLTLVNNVTLPQKFLWHPPTALGRGYSAAEIWNYDVQCITPAITRTPPFRRNVHSPCTIGLAVK